MNKDRIFWGCCFVLMGILLVTNQIWGTMDIGLFKIIVTVFCAAYIIRSVPSLSFFGIFIPIALILTMYRNDLGFDLKTSVIWGSAILVSIVLELIFKDAKKKDELHLSSSFFVVVCFNFIQQLPNPSQ